MLNFRPYINDQVLDIEHTRIVDTAMAEFDSRKKLGGEEFSLKYRDQLLTEIEESYNNYKAHNDSKNIFKAANTPITLFVMWSVLYIFSQVTSLLMLYPFANLANLLMWGLVVLGFTWAYAKYRWVPFSAFCLEGCKCLILNITVLAAVRWRGWGSPSRTARGRCGTQCSSRC